MMHTPPNTNSCSLLDASLGHVHSVESFGTIDGPGIRFVVFMQGCLMRCKYCHNPDTWDPNIGKILSIDALIKQIESYHIFFESSDGALLLVGREE